MPGPGSVPCPKPEKRSTTKGKRDRQETAVKASTRVLTVDRDGYCRFSGAALNPALLAVVGPCSGPSEQAHLEGTRQFETRGMAPEERHTTAGTCQMCHQHHQGPHGYDRHGFSIEFLTARGADGPLRVVSKSGGVYEEPREVFGQVF